MFQPCLAAAVTTFNTFKNETYHTAWDRLRASARVALDGFYAAILADAQPGMDRAAKWGYRPASWANPGNGSHFLIRTAIMDNLCLFPH